MLNDKRIKFCFDDSTAALTVACSFCVQSAILSALIRSPYSRGDHKSSSSSSSSEDEDEDRQAPVAAATMGVRIGNGSRGNNLGRL